MPRCRWRQGQSQVFSRRQRRQAQVDGLIREVFLAGVSTRRVGKTPEVVLGEELASSLAISPACQ